VTAVSALSNTSKRGVYNYARGRCTGLRPLQLFLVFIFVSPVFAETLSTVLTVTFCFLIYSRVSLIFAGEICFVDLLSLVPVLLYRIISPYLRFVSSVCCHQKTLVWLQEAEEKLTRVGPVGAACDIIRCQIDLVQVSIVYNPSGGKGVKRDS